MRDFAAASAVGALGMLVADGVWLGVLMTEFYRSHMAPVARLVENRFAPNWAAAAVVYALLGTGMALLVLPRASSGGSAAAWGAVFGLVVYGVYDFTNLATLRHWPLALTMVDVTWGAAACGLCSFLAWSASR